MENVKRIANIAWRIATWALVAFTVFMMVFTVVTVSTVNKNDRGIFGLRFYIVQTDSMSKSENNADMDVHFNAGDIIIIKKVKDARTLQAGDIIAFMSTNSVSYGETVTHMIREVRTSSTGQVLGYVTYGTNTGTNDEALVEPEYILGVYSGKMPAVGKFFAFVKSTPGYIICILVPFLLLIMYNGVNVIRLFRQYKKEQTAIIDAEKAEIAAERKQNEEMMKELLALKAQLTKQAATGTPPDEGEAALAAEQTEETVEETTEEPADGKTEEKSEEQA
jgi:signal peptidase I